MMALARIFIAVVLTMLARSIFAIGTIQVTNNCPYALMSGSDCEDPITLSPGQALTLNNGVGSHNTNFAKETSPLDIDMLFEYRFQDGVVYYQMTRLKGDQFAAEGWNIVASDTNCPPILNPHGEAEHKDGGESLTPSCPDSTDLDVTICPQYMMSGMLYIFCEIVEVTISLPSLCKPCTRLIS